MAIRILKPVVSYVLPIIAIGLSTWVAVNEYVHFKETQELQKAHYTELNQQYEESLRLAETALETEQEHYAELSKQYSELIKPHAQHEEVLNMLNMLQVDIVTAMDWLKESEDNNTNDEYIIQDVKRYNDMAEEAWRNSDYDQAKMMIQEAYDLLEEVGIVYSVGSPGFTPVTGIINESGRFLEDVLVISGDRGLKLIISRDTVALTDDNKPLLSMFIRETSLQIFPPSHYILISPIYEIGPGSTFEPPIMLSISYGPNFIPQDVNEEALVVGKWDNSAGKWEILVNSKVDLIEQIVSANISRLATFAILAPTK